MVEDDTFTEVAKHDFIVRTIFGFIFGILAAVVSIIFIIVSIVTKKYDLIVALSVMVLVGLGVSASCGYFLFKKEKKDENKKEL